MITIEKFENSYNVISTENKQIYCKSKNRVQSVYNLKDEPNIEDFVEVE